MWHEVLTDPKIQSLPMDQIGRYFNLLVYVSCHGDNGAAKISVSDTYLFRLFQVENFDQFKSCVSKFPNIEIDTHDNAEIGVSFLKWSTYQVDSTAYDRLKRHRKRQSVTPKEKDKEKEKEEEKEEEKDGIPYREIIEDLNVKTGKEYRSSSEGTKNKIRARWNEGFRLEDFKRVHDAMVKKWTGTEWAQYLRPETLYSPKFESYLNTEPQNSVPGYKQRPA